MIIFGYTYFATSTYSLLHIIVRLYGAGYASGCIAGRTSALFPVNSEHDSLCQFISNDFYFERLCSNTAKYCVGACWLQSGALENLVASFSSGTLSDMIPTQVVELRWGASDELRIAEVQRIFYLERRI